MVPLFQGRGAKSFWLARGRDGFPLQSFLGGLEEILPLLSELVLNRLSIPSGAVPREVSGLQQHVGAKRDQHVVGDGQYLPNRLLLCLLHVDD